MTTPNFDSSKKDKVQWRLDTTNWLDVLRNVKNLKSYYVAGGLFVDLEEGAFGFHLNGSLVEFETGLSRMLCNAEHRLVFEIYREHKGETSFYKKNLPLCPRCR